MTGTILITGATDGIGLALAYRYRAEAWRLVLVGRRPLAELDRKLFDESNYCQVDLARSGCETVVADFLRARTIDRLDVLLQNAGMGYVGAIGMQPPASIQRLVAVNLSAPIALTHALLPHLRRAGGKVVFISSVASLLPTPDHAVYTATKAALDGFARSLRVELSQPEVGQPVSVQVIHPGATRTGMHVKAGMDPARMDWRRLAPTGRVAEQIMAAIGRDRPEVTIGFANRLLRWVAFYANGLVDWVMRKGSG